MWFQLKKQPCRTRTARRQVLGSLRRHHEALEQRMLLSIAPNADSFMASNVAAISVAASPGAVTNVSTSTSVGVTSAGNPTSVVQSSFETTTDALPGTVTMDSVTNSVGTNVPATSNDVSTLTSVSNGMNVVDQQSLTNIVTSAGNLASVVQSSFETTANAFPGTVTMDSVTNSVGTNVPATSTVSTLTAVSNGLNVVNQQNVTNIATSAGNLASLVQSSFETTADALPVIVTMDSVSNSVGTNNPASTNVISTLSSVSGASNALDQQSLTNIVTSAGNLASVVQSSSETTAGALPVIVTIDSVSNSVSTNDPATSTAVSTLTSVSNGLNVFGQQSLTSIVTSAGNLASVVQSSFETVFQPAGNLNGPLAAGVDALMANELMDEEAAIAMFWAAA
ncbi:MAG TPA: hypothetical protein VND64_05745 [Pirellulales bacterium]|nr:hypothetical protein [Pirellulales bacterium]